MEIVRYNKTWYKIVPKPYEPERQTAEIAWMQIKYPDLGKEAAYRKYFEKQREDARILYPSFRKDDT